MNVVQGKLIPIRDNVLITDMNFEEQKTSGGIIIRSDDGKSEGVKPRWGKVWAIGKDQKDVQVGEWILIEHGRWTRGVTVRGDDGNEFVIRRVDTKAILLSTDEQPNDFYSGAHSTPSHGSTHSPEDFMRPHY
jgi:co-chaperonin GroES (HSP10)